MPHDILEPSRTSFFGVRHEDLPYSSERKGTRFNGPPPNLRDEGALLLSALTGVVNTNRRATTAQLKSGSLAKEAGDIKEKPANLSKEYLVYGRDSDSTTKRLGTVSSGGGNFFPESSFYQGRGLRRSSQGPADRSPRLAFASLPHTPRRMSLGQSGQLSDRRRSTVEGFSFRSPRPPRSPRRGLPKDEACDTSDIPITTFFVESDDELLNETVSALDLERQNMEEPMQRNKMALDDYMGQLKETTSRLGLRANMLHELTTEDIESSYSVLPPPPKARKLSVTGPVLEFEEEPEKATVGKHVKQARRLAGSMNVHQQSNGLRDIHSWLQHLGHIAQEEDFVDVAAGRIKPKDMEFGEGDWRLPSSPAMALQLAQEDLRNRLGSLYAERQEVLNRQAELMAATKLASRDGEAEEARLREFLRRMHMLEDEYHLLGGKLAENLSEAENLDRRHQRLRKDVHDSDQHGATTKSGENGPRVADGDQRDEAHVHADAKHKAGRKKSSKVEGLGLQDPGIAVLESKKKVQRRRSSQDQDGDHGIEGSSTAAETPGSASVSARAATVPSKPSPAKGSLVTATPFPEPEPTSLDELEDLALDTGTEGEIEKQDPSLSESIEQLLEDSDDEGEEAIDQDGPDLADVEKKKRKPRRKKTRDQDGTVASGGEEESRRIRPSKRQAEGEAGSSSVTQSFDYSNVNSMYESLPSQDAKGKYIRGDRKKSGSSPRGALEWKILLESGQCKHRSCQTDPSITERQKKARSSLFDAAGRGDSDAIAQMDSKELRREVVRLKQRLRFWRARNWADQHKPQPVATVPASLGPQYVIDDSTHVMYHVSTSETSNSRGAGGTPPIANPSALRGRESVSVSNPPDQEIVVHEENLATGLLPDSTPSFVVFGTSPNHTPRDSRAGSLVPARGSRTGSMVLAKRSRVNSKGSISIRRNSPGVEAVRLQATEVSSNSL